MSAESYLIFKLQGRLLALEAQSVREIIKLVEITPLDETPPYITGIVNLRGQIIPVMDLTCRFGYKSPRYRLTDSIIVMSAGGLQMGLLANEVQEVMVLAAEDISQAPECCLENMVPPKFATRVAKVGDNLVILLNHLNLLQDEGVPEKADLPEVPEIEDAVTYFCLEATGEERAIFRNRALSLMQSLPGEETMEVIPLAVVELSGEYFGIDVKNVLSFAKISSLIPIPCCPSHIAGIMNLRGQILTVVDIRSFLALPYEPLQEDHKVIVAGLGDLAVAVVVDQIHDIIYINPKDFGPVPSALNIEEEKYLLGIASYQEWIVTIMNLPAILRAENMVVNEEP